MAVYSYECKNCGATFDATYRMSDDSSESKCGECGAMAKKIPALSSFHLKGGGWYGDGYCGTGNKVKG